MIAKMKKEEDEYMEMFLGIEKPKVSRIKMIFFKIFMFIVTAMFFKIITDSLEKVNEGRRYKKIIKKGLFWDTEYLIEKD